MVIEEEEDGGSLAASSADVANYEQVESEFVMIAGAPERAAFARTGNDLIRSGKVAVVLLATESA